MKFLYKLLSSFLILIITSCLCFGGFVIYEYIAYKKGEYKDVTQVALVRDTDLKDSDFVDLSSYIPELKIELRYATARNEAGRVLYSSNKAYLRKGTADKLKKANDLFRDKGYTLKLWDGYRPLNVQYEIWDAVPDTRYIANPHRGSNHNRGAAVDVTLVDKEGKEVNMPSDFDEFGPKCGRDYSNISSEQKSNALFLEGIMNKCGFTSIYTEWWHFDDCNCKKYDIVKELQDKNLDPGNYELAVKGTELDYGAISLHPTFSEYLMDKMSEINLNSVKVVLKNNYTKLKYMFAEFNAKV